jgi:nucleoside phosphorylase
VKDFEPYFCPFEDCKNPFDSSDSFNTWIDHMLENHMPPIWHCKSPHHVPKSFLQLEEFEKHIRTHDETMTNDLLATLAKHSVRRDTRIFQSCPFCGGLPEELESQFPDQTTSDAQFALQKHVRDDLLKIALILPPIPDLDEELDGQIGGSSAIEPRETIFDPNETTIFPEMHCDPENPCDCKDLMSNSASDWSTMASTFFDLAGENSKPASFDDPAWPPGSQSFLSQLNGGWECLDFKRPIYNQVNDAVLLDFVSNFEHTEYLFDNSPDGYGIGIVCVTAIQRATMAAMLDEIHIRNWKTPRGDDNDYILGKVGALNVVIAGPPVRPANRTSTAVIAANMRRSFPVTFALLVGVGSGAPVGNNIYLGDVVVSQPTGTHGGVISLDITESPKGDILQRISSLNLPPPVLQNALQSLKVSEVMRPGGFDAHFSLMAVKRPPLDEIRRVERSQDLLFDSNYLHRGGETCNECSVGHLVTRLLAGSRPRIHYGTIVSSSFTIKSGRLRDRVANETDAICFDTEAAGLENDFPCLMIRGIADYADSHRNDLWRAQAAASAAAVARQLLLIAREKLFPPPGKFSDFNEAFQLILNCQC